MPTLSQKLSTIKTMLEELRVDAALALTVQGRRTEPDSYTLNELPELISQIRVYDFNYRFDFKALDSVGTIHSRAEGIAAGNSGITPECFNFKLLEKINMKTPTPITYCFSGVWGQNASIAIDCVFPNITYHKLNFKAITSAPEQFIAPPEEE